MISSIGLFLFAFFSASISFWVFPPSKNWEPALGTLLFFFLTCGERASGDPAPLDLRVIGLRPPAQSQRARAVDSTARSGSGAARLHTRSSLAVLRRAHARLAS